MARKEVGSIYPIGDGSRYRAVLMLKDEFGVPFRKEFTGKDPKALKKRMNNFRLDYEAGKPTDDMKVVKMCEIAIEACEKRGCAPKTLKGYRDFLKVHITPHVGNVKLRELQPAHVERMLQKMEDGGAGPQTRLLCRNFLRMSINRVGIKGGYVTTNAAGLADPPKVRRTARTALTPADLEKILHAEKRPMFRVLWLILASTGLRPSEARGLIWSDLTESEDGWWIKLRHSKTEEGKMPIPVPAAVMEDLKKVPKRGVYVFATATGEPINESNLRREWVKALETAGLPFTNLYQLRKLFGTLKARKVSDSVLKRLMRHTDARTTKQYYVTALEEDLRRAVES